ncbi:MAG: beta-N-acetylhexosaminidase [Polyangiales bacterium]
MKLSQIAGNVLVLGFEGTALDPRIRGWLSEDALGGLILFSRNIENNRQLRSLLEGALRESTSKWLPVLSVDQEGGRVARVKSDVLPLPPMHWLGLANDPELTYSAARLLGRGLRDLGFNLDFAPVLDVNSNPNNPVIGDRAFGDDPQTVIVHARQFTRGLIDAGIAACGKHFPGHGDTEKDSHLELPFVRHEIERLRAIEFAPFAALASELPSIMTAHVVFDAIDPDRPATMSHRAIEILRRDLRFEGVIFSDDLLMNAVNDRWGAVEAGLEAIIAGCDALLVCREVEKAEMLHEALIKEAESSSAFRNLLNAAVGRMQTLRKSLQPPAPYVPDELEARNHQAIDRRLNEIARRYEEEFE